MKFEVKSGLLIMVEKEALGGGVYTFCCKHEIRSVFLVIIVHICFDIWLFTQSKLLFIDVWPTKEKKLWVSLV